MRNNKKMSNGITLIALVVTIIVLLILAGISIMMLTGDNGILIRTAQAKEMTTEAAQKEALELAILSVISDPLEENRVLSTENLKNAIKNQIGTGKENNLTGNGPWQYNGEYGSFIIDNDGTVNKYTTKSISELYDGINDPTNKDYSRLSMHIGDYVDYNAGIWNQTKSIPTEENPLTFGGYTNGQSRDTNASYNNSYEWKGNIYGAGRYEGWRIWDISEDKKTMTIISAGCPEVFYFKSGLLGNAEKILLGETTREINTDYISDTRNFNEYLNTEKHAGTIKTITYGDCISWYKKYINNEVNDLENYVLPKANENKLISTLDNGFYYWIPGYSNYNTQLGSIFQEPDDYFCGWFGSTANGIRIMITLDDSVKFVEIPESIEQDGYTYNKWTID